MELKLIRTYLPRGTNGELLLNGDRLCYIIELPWKNNARQISCIPEGRYEIRERFTERFGQHFIVQRVPGRSYILIHAANDALKEIKGCICTVSQLTGEGRGSQARIALARLVAVVYPVFKKEKVFLTIVSGEKKVK